MFLLIKTKDRELGGSLNRDLGKLRLVEKTL